MQSVSNAYREAIQLHRTQGVRNPSYAQVYVGQFDSTARGDAVLSFSDAGVGISAAENVNSEYPQAAAYASWETDFFRLDGVQALLPDSDSLVLRQGFISEQIAAANGSLSTPITLTIEFSNLHRMAGLTLLFDDVSQTYASAFTVITYNADGAVVETHSITNTTPKYEGALTLDYCKKIVITFTQMTHGGQRLRLQQLMFGLGYTFGNAELFEVQLHRSTSPLSLELPQNKLSFTVHNENAKFDPDSGTSLSSFFADDQECNLSFGYDITGQGQIEWVAMGKFWLSKWYTEGMIAKFEAEDIFARLTKTQFRKGIYGLKSAKQIVDAVMSDAGYANYDAFAYELGENTSTIYNALPILSHAECLQLVANYAMCTLESDNDGTIVFRSRTVPTPAYITPTSNSLYMLGASTNDVVGYGDTVNEYASFEQDGFALSGNMLLVPDDDSSYINNGLVWDSFPTSSVPTSEAKEQYSPMPYLVFDFAATVSFGSLVLDFGENFVPTYVGIMGVRNVEGVTTTVYKKLWKMDAKRTVLVDNFDRVIWLYIFIVGSDKQQRARLQRASFSWENGYTITTADVLKRPKGERLTNCRNLKVYLDNRTAGTSAQFKETTIPAGVATWIEHGDMYSAVTASTPTAGATLVSECYAYASKITASGVTGDVVVRLTGKKMTQGAEDVRTVAINAVGEDCEIKNPLLSAGSIKSGYLAFESEHLARNIEWKADILGYPELQPGDVIGYKIEDVQAVIMDADITFKGGLRESLTLRKVENT
ncbi:MAG TPA: hypothetical protein VN538_12685 [Clostridia bacterium]|nr:hypothetical protein [Clostridia bacterium]